MAPMETSVISWGDPLNFCQVLTAEVRNNELLLLVHVEGSRHAPHEAEVMTSDRVPLRLAGRATETNERSPSAQIKSEGNEYILVFDCPDSLQCAEDVLFSYAPAYSCVHILDLILSSLVQAHPATSLRSSRETKRTLRTACNYSVGETTLKPSLTRKSAQLQTWVDHAIPESVVEKPCSSTKKVLQQVQPCRVEKEDISAMTKKPDAIIEIIVDGANSIGSCEAFFNAVEVGHGRTVAILERRLSEIQMLRRTWRDGDIQGFVLLLEASRDDAVLYGALDKLQSNSRQLMPARALARLLPLMQRLSQSDCEAHAVAAMRFVLQAMEVSWPAVCKALRDVATPKAIHDECQMAVQSVSCFYTMVKTMSRSVRISKTNGSLVPVCKKLKTSLEKALISVGRLRGAS